MSGEQAAAQETEEKITEALGTGDGEQPGGSAEEPKPGEGEGEGNGAGNANAEFTQEDWQASQDEAARANGWKPLDEYVADGNDPKDWVSAEVFNVRGEFIGKMRSQERQFERTLEDKVNQRVSGVKKLYEARMSDLQTQKKAAIEEGDVEAVEAIDKEMDGLKEETREPAKSAAPVRDAKAEEEWNERNPWILEDGAKSQYAANQYTKYMVQGMSTTDALAAVDKDIAREFPGEKPGGQNNQGKVPASERGKGSQGFSKKGGHQSSVTMDDLTPEEKNLWRTVPDFWDNDENKFLKAVADDRAAQG